MSTEFVKQTLRENLSRTLVPHVADGLWSIYDNAKTACERNKQPEKTIQTFQNLLTRIPQWTDEVLAKEVERITIASKCDYLEDLLLGVFVSYIRAFASLQQTEKTHVDVHFDRPSLSKFVHTFYRFAARKSWTQAYLFKTIGVTGEQQARNRRDIESMLETTMNEVIDSFIPWRDITRAYFHHAETAAAPVPEPETPSQPVKIQEEHNEVHEFETEDEDESDEEEERPRLQVGEEIRLEDLEDDDAASVNTEDELQQKATETVSLNL
jgi:hypothetical protein